MSAFGGKADVQFARNTRFCPAAFGQERSFKPFHGRGPGQSRCWLGSRPACPQADSELVGEAVGLRRSIFTVAIICGMDEFAYDRRYSHDNANEAVLALAAWKVSGDAEPSGYIVRK